MKLKREDIRKKKFPRESLHMLIVDDDPVFLRRVKSCARRLGVAVTLCKSANEVYHLIGCSFDVALVDYYLDVTDGSDVASVLEDVPVLMMSSLPLGFVGTPRTWPSSVKGFVPKERGIEELFEVASNLVSQMEKQTTSNGGSSLGKETA